MYHACNFFYNYLTKSFYSSHYLQPKNFLVRKNKILRFSFVFNKLHTNYFILCTFFCGNNKNKPAFQCLIQITCKKTISSSSREIVTANQTKHYENYSKEDYSVKFWHSTRINVAFFLTLLLHDETKEHLSVQCIVLPIKVWKCMRRGKIT